MKETEKQKGRARIRGRGDGGSRIKRVREISIGKAKT